MSFTDLRAHPAAHPTAGVAVPVIISFVIVQGLMAQGLVGGAVKG